MTASFRNTAVPLPRIARSIWSTSNTPPEIHPRPEYRFAVTSDPREASLHNEDTQTGIVPLPDQPPLSSKELANKVLREHFKIDNFRLKQEEAIVRVLDGESVMVVFPTGGGKSLCWLVAAVAF